MPIPVAGWHDCADLPRLLRPVSLEGVLDRHDQEDIDTLRPFDFSETSMDFTETSPKGSKSGVRMYVWYLKGA